MLIYRYIPADVETAGGDWAANTLDISGALCRQVFVKSASVTTEFDVTLTDRYNNAIRTWVDVIDELNDLTPFLVRGIYTVAITNATVDEAFNVELMCLEKGK